MNGVRLGFAPKVTYGGPLTFPKIIITLTVKMNSERFGGSFGDPEDGV